MEKLSGMRVRRLERRKSGNLTFLNKKERVLRFEYKWSRKKKETSKNTTDYIV